MEESTATLSAPPGAKDPTRGSSRAPSQRRREETSDSEKAGRVWARAFNDPWDPCILTLDGGGIRGYSSLLILKALMHEVWLWEQYYDNAAIEAHTDSPTTYDRDEEQADAGAARGRAGRHNEEVIESTAQDHITAGSSARTAIREEDMLPCHYFDFMYGTSTGGLIATILGRLRMSVTEGLELYRKVGEDLFGRRRSKVPLMTKYYHEPLEKAVRDVVISRCHEHENCDGDDLHPWQTHHFDVDSPRVCQSCCLTATHNENISEAYLLRTYPHFYSQDAPNWITRYNEGADSIPIWTVTRATSAAPFYFEMIKATVYDFEKSMHVERSFKDGGIRENNPSGAALSEFHALYEGRCTSPALMLSVGTGRPNQAHDGFASAWPTSIGRLPIVSKFLEKRAVLQNLLIKYTEGEKQHENMRLYAHGEHTWYKRLNVSQGFENMPLDDWQRGKWTDPATAHEQVINGGASLTRMEEATEEYLHRPFDPFIDSYAPPMTMLKQAAQKLVIQRRAREVEGGVRWDTFMGKHLPPHEPEPSSSPATPS